jgi:Sulfotransferase family
MMALNDDRIVVAFIGGYSRSGSTLLDRVLGRLSGAASTGELMNLTINSLQRDRLCGCGEHFCRCHFWQAVGARAFREGWHGDEARELTVLHRQVVRHRKLLLLALPLLAPRFRRRLDRYADLLARVYKAIADEHGSRLVIDSSIEPIYAYALRHVPGIELRIIHLVRDSRGTAFSWTKRQLMQSSPHEAADKGTYPPLVTALRWELYHLLLATLRLLGVRQVLVRYEDMTAHPRETSAALLDYLGQPTDRSVDVPFIDDTTIVLDKQHTALGNDMRFRTGSVAIRSDDAWKSALPRRHRILVSLTTLPLLMAYGYLTSPPLPFSRRGHQRSTTWAG